MGLDLQPEPGASHTIAADFGASDLYPQTVDNVTVYDDGIARTETAAAGLFSDEGDLAWGAGNAQLYAASPTTANWLLDTFNVDASGLTFVQRQTLPGPAPTGGGRLHFDSTTGYLYDDSGSVYDPVSGTSVGSYNASGFVAVDSTMNRVFILGQVGSGYAIDSFNKSSYALIGSLGLQLVGTPVAFIRWGSNGLALLTFNENAAAFGGGLFGTGTGPAGMLYIINDKSFVSANAIPAKDVGDMPRVHSFRRILPLARLHRRDRSQY